ncbi:Acetoin catabolism regulatory protein [compost metagenome]
MRELRNVLRTLAALCEDGIVRLADLPREVLRSSAASSVVESPANPLDDAERSALISALDSQRWHMTRTAEQLGISRNTLYRKLRKHAIATRG